MKTIDNFKKIRNMKNLFSVKDKVVVITGAAGILGTAMVRHFAEEGAKVVVLDRNEAAGNRLVDEVNAKGQTALYLYSDVLDKPTLESNYQAIMDRF